MIWLWTIDMPVSFPIILSTYVNDFLSMNQLKALLIPDLEIGIPFFALIGAGLLIAFSIARILLFLIPMSNTLVYSVAGGSAIIAIVVLMPLEFYNLDLLPGGRTFAGKVTLGICGLISGYYFGSKIQGAK